MAVRISTLSRTVFGTKRSRFFVRFSDIENFIFLQVGSELMEGKNVWGYLDLIKTFWNLAWFGGSQNLFKQVDTVIPSNLFSEKLQLSDKELSLAKNSFLDFNLDNLYNQVRIWLEVASIYAI